MKLEAVGGLLGLVGIGVKNYQENTLLGKQDVNMNAIKCLRCGSSV